MNATLSANMQKLAKTIKDIVNNMKPTVICMCEVGEVKYPLDSDQMQKVADAAILAWKDAATEHIQLRSMFTTGAPYITLYINGPIQCSEHRILRNLYQARDGLPRTAQAFVCSSGSGESMDVINVHAPSGSCKLKDKQRTDLLTNVLQSSSNATPGVSIGRSKFLLGGDMNTKNHQMSQLLSMCRSAGSLHTEEQIHERADPQPKHGDLCIAAGVQATT